MSSSSAETITARAAYLMGDAVLEWAGDAVAAWTGFLEVFAQIKRDVDHQLEIKHALSMSMVGLLGRLAAADRRTVRLTDLAGAMGLSLSRVSASSTSSKVASSSSARRIRPMLARPTRT